MTNSKRKGKDGELELAKKLRELGFHGVRRGQQYSGLEGEDVVGLAGIHVECKRHKQPTLARKWIRQAAEDCNDDQIPIVCHRADRHEWLVTLRLVDIMKLTRAIALFHDTFKENDG